MSKELEFGDQKIFLEFLGMGEKTAHQKLLFMRSFEAGEKQSEEVENKIDNFFDYKKLMVRKSTSNLEAIQYEVNVLKNHLYKGKMHLMTAENIENILSGLCKKLNKIYDERV